MNNTHTVIPVPVPVPIHPVPAPIVPNSGNSSHHQMLNLFDANDDCDELKLSGNFEQQMVHRSSKNFNALPRFKERIIHGIQVKHQNVQRKFYRKVGIGEFIYTQETFKQGLNLLIIQRDRRYTKCKSYFNY
jgi:hypothetical protein